MASKTQTKYAKAESNSALFPSRGMQVQPALYYADVWVSWRDRFINPSVRDDT